ncbi:Oidioi.mRNA.OKI2018_I69.chr1.g2549.t1.cds [Oikopleura dioica]|uniref:Oidioi.mRNA.OKI2018_I69.chr1.g2549.t1.cds n=1 Tax=Oikopleura dioica TaxID=34765 RepID=A0ABN7SXU0_OIKDI|nr:Oidioi.mRNA.OKI2018_I69.chr1.g2549.t1.cds [Oikopleura dioica]
MSSNEQQTSIKDDYNPESDYDSADSADDEEMDRDELTKEEIEDEKNDLLNEADIPLEELMRMYQMPQGDDEQENKEEVKDDAGESSEAGLNRSALTTIMNTSSLDDGTDEEDADYQPRIKMNSNKHIYKEPRIGEQYQVSPANIPEVLKADDSAKEETLTLETTLWKPSEEDPLTFYRTLQNSKKRKRKEPSTERLSANHERPPPSPFSDNEEALFDFFCTNYKIPLAVKRVQHRQSQRNPRHQKWTAEEKAAFEVGVATKGKNFFKIREEYLPKKDVKDLVLHYYFWKKSANYDTFSAKTRSKRNGNSTNYMEKLIEELETKRPRRNGPRAPEEPSSNTNGHAKTETNAAQSESTAPTSNKVMTLQLNGDTWSVSED